MLYKNYLLILTSLIMFSLFEKVEAKYDKLFFDFSIKGLNNETINLSEFKGKTILLVNVASKCGFTKQYTGLQTLYDNYKDKEFLVIGVPSNQFGGQEPGSEEEIKGFCQKNYGVTFLMASKINVKGEEQHPLYQWLTQLDLNNVEDSKVGWNFTKYLIDDKGNYIENFKSKVSPMSEEITKHIK